MGRGAGDFEPRAVFALSADHLRRGVPECQFGKRSCQFSFACDGKSTWWQGNRLVRESWVKANLIAFAAFKQYQAGGDTPDALPSTALFYHAKRVNPNWADSFKLVATIGSRCCCGMRPALTPARFLLRCAD